MTRLSAAIERMVFVKLTEFLYILYNSFPSKYLAEHKAQNPMSSEMRSAEVIFSRIIRLLKLIRLSAVIWREFQLNWLKCSSVLYLISNTTQVWQPDCSEMLQTYSIWQNTRHVSFFCTMKPLNSILFYLEVLIYFVQSQPKVTSGRLFAMKLVSNNW